MTSIASRIQLARSPRKASRAVAFSRLLLLAILLGPFANATVAQEVSKPVDPQFRDAIRAYIEAQNASEMTGQAIAYGMAEQTLVAISQTGQEVTENMQKLVLEESLTTFGKRFSNVDVLADLYAPIYAEHFTTAEIKEITTFYRSKVGRKTIDLMVPITQAGNAALQQATFEFLPGFQHAVDAKLKQAGISPTTAP